MKYIISNINLRIHFRLSLFRFVREKIRVETYPSVFKCVAHLIENFNIIGIISNFFLIGMKSLFNFHYQIIIYHVRLWPKALEKLLGWI